VITGFLAGRAHDAQAGFFIGLEHMIADRTKNIFQNFLKLPLHGVDMCITLLLS